MRSPTLEEWVIAIRSGKTYTGEPTQPHYAIEMKRLPMPYICRHRQDEPMIFSGHMNYWDEQHRTLTAEELAIYQQALVLAGVS